MWYYVSILFLLLTFLNTSVKADNYTAINSKDTVYILNNQNGTLKKLENDKLTPIEELAGQSYPKSWTNEQEYQLDTFWVNDKIFFKLVLFNNNFEKFTYSISFKNKGILIKKLDSLSLDDQFLTSHGKDKTIYEGQLEVPLDEYLSFEDIEVTQLLKSTKGQLNIKKIN
ncbi:hypothetical protein BVY03_02830 [bacterium K02(2017)]|nr:hypothetical protein BVY03_02830 [bacterium K02(2017)]